MIRAEIANPNPSPEALVLTFGENKSVKPEISAVGPLSAIVSFHMEPAASSLTSI